MKNVINKLPKVVAVLVVAPLLSLQAMAEQRSIDSVEQAFRQNIQTGLSHIKSSQSGYTKALAGYRLALLKRGKGNESAFEKNIVTAISELKNNIEQGVELNESKILLGHLYGIQISIDPSQATTLGPKSQEMFQGIKAVTPNNPRAYLLDGIAKLHMPVMYGGGEQAAITLFKKAISLYPSDADSEYHWGYDETYIWLGIAHEKMNQIEEAKQYWSRALEISPDSGWARKLLSKASI